MLECDNKWKIWQNSATELTKEAFLSVTEESFPSHLSGLENLSLLRIINCWVTFFPLTLAV